MDRQARGNGDSKPVGDDRLPLKVNFDDVLSVLTRNSKAADKLPTLFVQPLNRKKELFVC